MDLKKIIEGLDESVRPLGAEVVSRLEYIQARLDELQKLPFIAVCPNNQMKQKPTVAGKQYKELSQQYNSYIKTLLQMAGKGGSEETVSPLREYLSKIEKRS